MHAYITQRSLTVIVCFFMPDAYPSLQVNGSGSESMAAPCFEKTNERAWRTRHRWAPCTQNGSADRNRIQIWIK